MTPHPTLLPDQRHLFDIPADVAYLNCAYMSPLAKAVVAAGEAGLRRKAQPWTVTPQDFFTDSEVVRGLFARLVNATAEDVALIPARSEEHTSELQSLMRISYAVF